MLRKQIEKEQKAKEKLDMRKAQKYENKNELLNMKKQRFEMA